MTHSAPVYAQEITATYEGSYDMERLVVKICLLSHEVILFLAHDLKTYHISLKIQLRSRLLACLLYLRWIVIVKNLIGAYFRSIYFC